MKIRTGFVSNSSSCSFTITNLSDKELTIVDFVKENPQFVKDFIEEYDWYKEDKFNQGAMISSAQDRINKSRNSLEYIFKPHQSNYLTFGDEEGDIIGHVFDYMLRDGGKSENFIWNLEEMNR